VHPQGEWGIPMRSQRTVISPPCGKEETMAERRTGESEVERGVRKMKALRR
jgi:hypothetical protein